MDETRCSCGRLKEAHRLECCGLCGTGQHTVACGIRNVGEREKRAAVAKRLPVREVARG